MPAGTRSDIRDCLLKKYLRIADATENNDWI